MTEEFENDLIKKEQLVYGISKGRTGYAFKLENINKFVKPIPAKGQLGLWEYEYKENKDD